MKNSSIGPLYSNGEVCYYYFPQDATASAIYPGVEFIFDYYLAANIYLINGAGWSNSYNLTIPKFG